MSLDWIAHFGDADDYKHLMAMLRDRSLGDLEMYPDDRIHSAAAFEEIEKKIQERMERTAAIQPRRST